MLTAELIFEQAGIKKTAPRLAVISVLVETNDPLTHQEILKKLPENFDRVTLYRVLDWLLQNEVVHRIAGEDRAWRFHLNMSHHQYNQATVSTKKRFITQHEHAHFQCANCGKMFCLENVQPRLTDAMPTDFVVDSIELNIKGKCANCAKLIT